MNKTVWVRWLESFSDNLKSKIKNRKWVGIAALVFTLAMSGAVALAQQPKQLPRIGYLAANFPSTNAARIEAFRQGLRDLGYVEGKSIVIEWRYAEGKPDRLPALAAELVHLKVDTIVTGGRSATRAAKEATSTIPIVMRCGPAAAKVRHPPATSLRRSSPESDHLRRVRLPPRPGRLPVLRPGRGGDPGRRLGVHRSERAGEDQPRRSDRLRRDPVVAPGRQ